MNIIGNVGKAKYTAGGEVRSAFYHDGGVALEIFSSRGKEATATVCLSPEGPTPKKGFVWLKGWGGNEGIPEALEKAGIVKRTGETHPTGFVNAELAELTNKPK